MVVTFHKWISHKRVLDIFTDAMTLQQVESSFCTEYFFIICKLILHLEEDRRMNTCYLFRRFQFIVGLQRQLTPKDKEPNLLFNP